MENRLVGILFDFFFLLIMFVNSSLFCLRTQQFVCFLIYIIESLRKLHYLAMKSFELLLKM